MVRNFRFGLSALALLAAAPVLAAPASTSARAQASGPQSGFVPTVSQSGPGSSTAALALPANSTEAASAFALADFGLLKASTSVSFTNYVHDPMGLNSVFALANASFSDTLTGVSVDPVGFARITLQIDGSVFGDGGLTRVFGDSRFGVFFTASSNDNNHSARFDLLSLISADPLTGAVVQTNSLYTESTIGGLLQSNSSTNPANAFGTYEWVFAFDISQPWTVSGSLSCLTASSANGNDSSNLDCNLGNSVTWQGIEFLDANSDPVTGATVSSLSGQNYSQPYSPLPAVPEPASWAMLIAGFGLVGATARRRRMATA